jgi:hypothetical protein
MQGDRCAAVFARSLGRFRAPKWQENRQLPLQLSPACQMRDQGQPGRVSHHGDRENAGQPVGQQRGAVNDVAQKSDMPLQSVAECEGLVILAQH